MGWLAEISADLREAAAHQRCVRYDALYKSTGYFTSNAVVLTGFCWLSGTNRPCQNTCNQNTWSTLEVGRHIENIVDISHISIYRYRYRIGTLDIGFCNISTSYWWQVKYRYFFNILSYFFRLFNANLKTDNYMSKIEYLIYVVTPHYIDLY